MFGVRAGEAQAAPGLPNQPASESQPHLIAKGPCLDLQKVRHDARWTQRRWNDVSGVSGI